MLLLTSLGGNVAKNRQSRNRSFLPSAHLCDARLNGKDYVFSDKEGGFCVRDDANLEDSNTYLNRNSSFCVQDDSTFEDSKPYREPVTPSYGAQEPLKQQFSGVLAGGFETSLEASCPRKSLNQLPSEVDPHSFRYDVDSNFLKEYYTTAACPPVGLPSYYKHQLPHPSESSSMAVKGSNNGYFYVGIPNDGVLLSQAICEASVTKQQEGALPSSSSPYREDEAAVELYNSLLKNHTHSLNLNGRQQDSTKRSVGGVRNDTTSSHPAVSNPTPGQRRRMKLKEPSNASISTTSDSNSLGKLEHLECAQRVLSSSNDSGLHSAKPPSRDATWESSRFWLPDWRNPHNTVEISSQYSHTSGNLIPQHQFAATLSAHKKSLSPEATSDFLFFPLSNSDGKLVSTSFHAQRSFGSGVSVSAENPVSSIHHAFAESSHMPTFTGINEACYAAPQEDMGSLLVCAGNPDLRNPAAFQTWPVNTDMPPLMRKNGEFPLFLGHSMNAGEEAGKSDHTMTFPVSERIKKLSSIPSKGLVFNGVCKCATDQSLLATSNAPLGCSGYHPHPPHPRHLYREDDSSDALHQLLSGALEASSREDGVLSVFGASNCSFNVSPGSATHTNAPAAFMAVDKTDSIKLDGEIVCDISRKEYQHPLTCSVSCYPPHQEVDASHSKGSLMLPLEDYNHTHKESLRKAVSYEFLKESYDLSTYPPTLPASSSHLQMRMLSSPSSSISKAGILAQPAKTRDSFIELRRGYCVADTADWCVREHIERQLPNFTVAAYGDEALTPSERLQMAAEDLKKTRFSIPSKENAVDECCYIIENPPAAASLYDASIGGIPEHKTIGFESATAGMYQVFGLDSSREACSNRNDRSDAFYRATGGVGVSSSLTVDAGNVGINSIIGAAGITNFTNISANSLYDLSGDCSEVALRHEAASLTEEHRPFEETSLLGTSGYGSSVNGFLSHQQPVKNWKDKFVVNSQCLPVIDNRWPNDWVIPPFLGHHSGGQLTNGTDTANAITSNTSSTNTHTTNNGCTHITNTAAIPIASNGVCCEGESSVSSSQENYYASCNGEAFAAYYGDGGNPCCSMEVAASPPHLWKGKYAIAPRVFEPPPPITRVWCEANGEDLPEYMHSVGSSTDSLGGRLVSSQILHNAGVGGVVSYNTHSVYPEQVVSSSNAIADSSSNDKIALFPTLPYDRIRPTSKSRLAYVASHPYCSTQRNSQSFANSEKPSPPRKGSRGASTHTCEASMRRPCGSSSTQGESVPIADALARTSFSSAHSLAAYCNSVNEKPIKSTRGVCTSTRSSKKSKETVDPPPVFLYDVNSSESGMMADSINRFTEEIQHRPNALNHVMEDFSSFSTTSSTALHTHTTNQLISAAEPNQTQLVMCDVPSVFPPNLPLNSYYSRGASEFFPHPASYTEPIGVCAADLVAAANAPVMVAGQCTPLRDISRTCSGANTWQTHQLFSSSPSVNYVVTQESKGGVLLDNGQTQVLVSHNPSHQQQVLPDCVRFYDGSVDLHGVSINSAALNDKQNGEKSGFCGISTCVQIGTSQIGQSASKQLSHIEPVASNTGDCDVLASVGSRSQAASNTSLVYSVLPQDPPIYSIPNNQTSFISWQGCQSHLSLASCMKKPVLTYKEPQARFLSHTQQLLGDASLTNLPDGREKMVAHTFQKDEALDGLVNSEFWSAFVCSPSSFGNTFSDLVRGSPVIASEEKRISRDLSQPCEEASCHTLPRDEGNFFRPKTVISPGSGASFETFQDDLRGHFVGFDAKADAASRGEEGSAYCMTVMPGQAADFMIGNAEKNGSYVDPRFVYLPQHPPLPSTHFQEGCLNQFSTENNLGLLGLSDSSGLSEAQFLRHYVEPPLPLALPADAVKSSNVCLEKPPSSHRKIEKLPLFYYGGQLAAMNSIDFDTVCGSRRRKGPQQAHHFIQRFQQSFCEGGANEPSLKRKCKKSSLISLDCCSENSKLSDNSSLKNTFKFAWLRGLEKENLKLKENTFSVEDFDVGRGGNGFCLGNLEAQRELLINLILCFLARIPTFVENSKKVKCFDAISPPSIGIRDYFMRIVAYFNCSETCFLLSLIYIDRLCQRYPDVKIDALNVHRILLTSVMCAVKFYDDVFFSNKFYAQVGGVTTQEINRLERRMLAFLGYRLFVTPVEFFSYSEMLSLLATDRRYHVNGHRPW